MKNRLNIGFSIKEEIKRTDKRILDRFKEIGTCAISDALEMVLKLAEQKLEDDSNWINEISKGVIMIPLVDEALRENGVIE